MIHTARQNPKFKLFVRRIRPLVSGAMMDAESFAIAILERLWHATATGAIRGDIGRFDNELIAEMCGWLGDANQLISELISTGWIDECSEHRLLIHDWKEHAPKFVKANVTKGVKASPPKPGFFSPASKDSPKEPLQGAPKDDSQELLPPNPTQPNETQRNPTQPNETKESGLTPPLRNDLRDVLPDRFRTGEFFGAIEYWATTRSDADGELIGLDAMTLTLQLSKFAKMSTEDVYECLADAASGGWKSLRRPDKGRGSPAKQSTTDFIDSGLDALEGL